jgi:hypothetical protein
MSKGGPSHPNQSYFKGQGGRVESRVVADGSKQALGRETARRRRRAGRKTALGEAPAEQRAKEAPKPGARKSSTVPVANLAKTAAPKRVKTEPAKPKTEAPRKTARASAGEPTSRLGQLARRVADAAMAPVTFARAVVGYLRSGRE